MFNYVLDQNADGVLDEAELADIYEIGTEPCIKAFFKDCAKGRETFTEAEFCSCFSTAGKEELTYYILKILKVKGYYYCYYILYAIRNGRYSRISNFQTNIISSAI